MSKAPFPYVTPEYQALDTSKYCPHLVIVHSSGWVEYLDLTSRELYYHDPVTGGVVSEYKFSLERTESLLRGSVWEEPVTNWPGVYGTVHPPTTLKQK